MLIKKSRSDSFPEYQAFPILMMMVERNKVPPINRQLFIAMVRQERLNCLILTLKINRKKIKGTKNLSPRKMLSDKKEHQ